MQIAIIRIHIYLIGFWTAAPTPPDPTSQLVKVKQKGAAISQSAINVSQLIDLQCVIQGHCSAKQIDIDRSRIVLLVLCFFTVSELEWYLSLRLFFGRASESSSADWREAAAAHLKSWCFIQSSSAFESDLNESRRIRSAHCQCHARSPSSRAHCYILRARALPDPVGPRCRNAAPRRQMTFKTTILIVEGAEFPGPGQEVASAVSLCFVFLIPSPLCHCPVSIRSSYSIE